MGWFSSSKKKNKSGQKFSSSSSHQAQRREGVNRQPAGNQGAGSMIDDFVILELPNSAKNNIMNDEKNNINNKLLIDADSVNSDINKPLIDVDSDRSGKNKPFIGDRNSNIPNKINLADSNDLRINEKNILKDSNDLIINEKNILKDSNDLIINEKDIPEGSKENIVNKEHDNIVNENKPPAREEPKVALDENGLPVVPDVRPIPQYQKYSLEFDKSTAVFEDEIARAGTKKKAEKIEEEPKQNILNDYDPFDNGLRIEGLGEIEAEDARNKRPVDKGFPGFVAKARKADATGLGRKIANRIGYLPGKIGGTAVTLGSSPILLPYVGYNKLRSKGVKENGQKERVHDLIPGWRGEKFEKPDQDGLEMLEDQRRVPTVWSYPTAGEAVDSDGNLKDPEITVYMQKTEQGNWKRNPESSGHGFIGLRYSRYSAKKKRMERNELIYGFYPAGGFVNRPVTGASQILKGSTVPGQLKDDRNHEYAVSRRYPAKAWQIAAIVKASEKFPDKGYNAMYRNCVTFVREMVGNTAHLDTGGVLFKEEEIRFSALEDILIGTAGLFQGYIDEAGMTVLNQRAGKKDLSYQGYGNMRVTGQDVKNYKATQKFMHGTKKGVFPSLVAERLYSTGKTSTGVLGSFSYAGRLGDNVTDAEAKPNNITLDSLIQQIGRASGNLLDDVSLKIANLTLQPENDEARQLQEEIGNELNRTDEAFNDLKEVITNYYDMKKNPKKGGNDKINEPKKEDDPDKDGNDEINEPEKKDIEIWSVKDLQDAYEKLNKAAFEISKLHSKVMRADPDLDKKTANLLSLIELGRRYINRLYAEKGSDSDRMTDLKGYRDSFSNETIRVWSDDNKVVLITPSHYESYLQIYGASKEAIKKYGRFRELQEKANKTSAEKEEYNALRLIDDTADEYDKAHQYMLEREDYSQQDLDYIFSLRKREFAVAKTARQKIIVEAGNTASGIYRSLVTEKILGGMKEHYLSNPAHYKDEKSVETWINNFVSRRLKMHQGLLTMIIRAMLRSDIKMNDATVRQTVNDMIGQGYVEKVFEETDFDDRLGLANLNAGKAFIAFSAKTDTGYSEILDSAIQRARDMENTGAPLEKVDDNAILREQESEKNGSKLLLGKSGNKVDSLRNVSDSRLLSSKKLTRTYNTGHANMLLRSMSQMFATNKGILVYNGIQKDLRKLIEKTAGKEAAKCSGADSARFLARACGLDGYLSSMLDIIMKNPYQTDRERKQLIRNYIAVIKAVEQRIDKRTLRAIAQEMQLKVALQ